MLSEIDDLIMNLRGRGEDKNADTIQMLRDKYIKLRAENYARMTQPQPEIHIYLNDDQPTIPHKTYCQCIRCIKGDKL